MRRSWDEERRQNEREEGGETRRGFMEWGSSATSTVFGTSSLRMLADCTE